MKKFTLLLSAMLLSMMSFAAEYTATISFANKAQRTVYTSEQQVWEQNGLVVTNDKAASTTNVGDYANPVRFYKSSAVTVKCTLGTIKKIVFTCGSYQDKDYPGDLAASIGAEASVNGLDVTVVPNASSDTYKIAQLTAQVRVASIAVTYDGDKAPEGGGNEGGGTVPPADGVITCAQAVEICKATGETATTDTYTIRGYVTEIKEAYTDQYKNVSCWMADEKGGGQVFLAFRVKPINEADKAVKVNDYIEVKGNLVNYYSNTPETTAGGSMTIIIVGEEGEKPSLPEGLTGDGTKENPFTIEDVMTLNNQFAGPYYVKAFIVGQVNGKSIETGAEFNAPFSPSTDTTTYNTNLLVASSADVADVAKCVPVQLPAGDLRTNFNLPENSDMDGKEVLICGGLVKYFGVAGIKSPTSIELLNADPNVVNVKNLPYAEAYYYESDNVYEFMLYNFDEATEELLFPIVIMGVNAKSKTAINGTYEVLTAMYATGVDENDEAVGVISDGEGTLTIKNVDNEGNYSFVGSFVGEDGKTYKLNTVSNVYAMDPDTDEEITLKEEDRGNGNTDPIIPPVGGAIVFDADVDKGNAGTDSNNAAAYQITKNGVTVEVTSGILGTYNNEAHYRIYKNQTLTITSTVGNIAKIEFTCTANNEEKYGPGCFTVDGEYTYSGAVGTWTGDAASVTFAATSNQVRATQIVVTLAGTTDVENVVVGQTPTKVIENGQVLIIRGENIYNILGIQVK